MLIKFGTIEKGNDFMFRSEGAATIYTALEVNKVSEYRTEVVAIGKISNRKSRFLKTNSVRVILFN